MNIVDRVKISRDLESEEFPSCIFVSGSDTSPPYTGSGVATVLIVTGAGSTGCDAIIATMKKEKMIPTTTAIQNLSNGIYRMMLPICEHKKPQYELPIL